MLFRGSLAGQKKQPGKNAARLLSKQISD